jgi:hypothetical protein
MTMIIANGAEGALAALLAQPWLAADRADAATAGLENALADLGCTGEIEHYEAWLYGSRAAEPERLPDHYLFGWTRDELQAEIDRLPHGFAHRIVVMAVVDGERREVDPYGNALDADGASVVANAV